MKINGSIQHVDVDGYERLLTIQATARTVWCNHVQPNEYLQSDQISIYLCVGARHDFSVVLTLVTKGWLIGIENNRGMAQDVLGSPHAIAIGEIVRKLAPDIYVMSISESDEIEVQFENDMEFEVGNYIRVEGELATEDAAAEEGK